MMSAQKLREALRKQGIYVHENDPVLDMAVICETAMADSLKAIEGVVKAAADHTSAASAQAVDTSKKAAEAIINEGAAYLVAQFRETVQEVSQAVLADMRQEVLQAKHASRAAVTAGWIVGGIGAILLAGLAGILVGGIRLG